MKWIKFNPKAVNLPKERKSVLVYIAEDESQGEAACICVGYLRRWSNGNNYFVTPGLGERNREITHWCDCLDDKEITKAFIELRK